MNKLLAPLALASFALAPSAAGQDFVQVLLQEGQSIPGVGGTISTIRTVTAGVDAGWAALVNMTGTGGGPTIAVVGSLTGGLDTPPTLLRVPQVVGGLPQQGGPRSLSLAGGRLAYSSYVQGAMPGWAVFVDDQVIVQPGDPIPGTTDRWYGADSVQQLVGGQLLINGYLQDGAGDIGLDVALSFPNQSVFLREGDVLPGISQSVRRFHLTWSPSGNHLMSRVQFFGTSNPLDAVLVDGQFISLDGGVPFVRAGTIPDSVAGSAGRRWASIGPSYINDAGEVAVTGTYDIGAQNWYINLRDGVPISPAAPRQEAFGVTGIDLDGYVLLNRVYSQNIADWIPHLHGVDLFRADIGVDVDLDGQPDVGASIREFFSVAVEDTVGRSDLLAIMLLESSGAPTTRAVVRIGDYSLGQSVCAGVPNSTGRSGKILATRSDVAARNDFVLHCIDLPTDSAGLALTSLSTGFVPQAGGSQGTLCLGGAIGRLNSGVFLTERFGHGHVDLDLSGLPQGGGSTPVMAGQTWHFQVWYRDTVNGTATSNFTSAVAVPFR